MKLCMHNFGKDYISPHLLGDRLRHVLQELDGDLVAHLLGHGEADLLRDRLLDLHGTGLGEGAQDWDLGD